MGKIPHCKILKLFEVVQKSGHLRAGLFMFGFRHTSTSLVGFYWPLDYCCFSFFIFIFLVIFCLVFTLNNNLARTTKVSWELPFTRIEKCYDKVQVMGRRYLCV